MPNVVLPVVSIKVGAGFRNSTDKVGGWFIPNLHEPGRTLGRNPTDEVGGLFIPNLHEPGRTLGRNPTDEVGGWFIPD